MTELLLLSNSTSPGLGFLEHALDTIAGLVRPGQRLLFVPFASGDPDGYTDVMSAALTPLSIKVTSVHRSPGPVHAIEAADAIFIGGGNSFRLLRALQATGLGAAIAASPGRPAVPGRERGHHHGMSHAAYHQ